MSLCSLNESVALMEMIVQLLSHVWLFVTPWMPHASLPCPSISPGVCSNSCALSRMMPSNHLILCYPLLLPPSTFPSIRVFSSELALHIRLPNYWSFSFSISPSNEYSGLISFMIDWFNLLPVQEILKYTNTKKIFFKDHFLLPSFLPPSLLLFHSQWCIS